MSLINNHKLERNLQQLQDILIENLVASDHHLELVKFLILYNWTTGWDIDVVQLMLEASGSSIHSSIVVV